MASGIIGNKVDEFLSSKYGTRKSNILGGITALVFGLILLFIYLFIYKAPTMSSLTKININYSEVKFSNGSNNDSIQLFVGKEKLSINYSLWKDIYETNFLVGELKKGNKCFLWVNKLNRNKIFGLETESIFISPANGLDIESSNRFFLLLLSIFFTCLGIGYLVYEQKVKRV